MGDNSVVEEALATGLVQPDSTTCGSCALVVARMLDDSAYARLVVNGTDAAGGGGRAPDTTLQQRFRREVLAMHRLTSGFQDSRGGWQVPWPTALGTQPWALAREMTNEAGAKGRSYTARPILPSQREAAFRTMVSLAGSGYNVPLYVGNNWSPRHVVLVLPWDEQPSDEVRIYDPASGGRYPIGARDFSAGTLDVAGWNLPWVVVVPT